jgi:hypothetical protein
VNKFTFILSNEQMTKINNVHLDELNNFKVEIFSFELIYYLKMYFKKSLCRVSDLALGKPVFAECFFFAEC